MQHLLHIPLSIHCWYFIGT